MSTVHARPVLGGPPEHIVVAAGTETEQPRYTCADAVVHDLSRSGKVEQSRLPVIWTQPVERSDDED